MTFQVTQGRPAASQIGAMVCPGRCDKVCDMRVTDRRSGCRAVCDMAGARSVTRCVTRRRSECDRQAAQIVTEWAQKMSQNWGGPERVRYGDRTDVQMTTQKRPRRDEALRDSRRIDIYIPQAVWAKLKAQATRRKVGVSRIAAEVLTQWAGKGNP